MFTDFLAQHAVSPRKERRCQGGCVGLADGAELLLLAVAGPAPSREVCAHGRVQEVQSHFSGCPVIPAWEPDTQA